MNIDIRGPVHNRRRRDPNVGATLVLAALLLLAACSRTADTPTTTATTSVISTATTARALTSATREPTRTQPPATTAPSPTNTMPAATAVPSPTSTLPAATATQDARPPEMHDVSVTGNMITLPAGLTIEVFAEGLGAPRFMALDDDDVLYVTDAEGRVLKLPDANGDGRADEIVVIADGLDSPNGITFHQGELFVAETSSVSRIVGGDADGAPHTLDTIIDGLPSDGGHFTRTIRFGPDGMLYVSIGSSCNVCVEDDPRRASIVRYAADGTSQEMYATGLRNAVGITFQPDTGALWATNNGRDGMGDDLPPETVNLVTQGADFGWPRCHAGIIVDPDFGGDRGCDGIASPAVMMQAHSAPLGLTFTNGSSLGPDWDGALFVAFHGSWDRTTPTGFKVVALPLHDGYPTGDVVDFATGWLLPDGGRWGRPVDVLQAEDGSLLISDDWGGRIFRVFPAD